MTRWRRLGSNLSRSLLSLAGVSAALLGLGAVLGSGFVVPALLGLLPVLLVASLPAMCVATLAVQAIPPGLPVPVDRLLGTIAGGIVAYVVAAVSFSAIFEADPFLPDYWSLGNIATFTATVSGLVFGGTAQLAARRIEDGPRSSSDIGPR